MSEHASGREIDSPQTHVPQEVLIIDYHPGSWVIRAGISALSRTYARKGIDATIESGRMQPAGAIPGPAACEADRGLPSLKKRRGGPRLSVVRQFDCALFKDGMD
jgi:hypothetical protein